MSNSDWREKLLSLQIELETLDQESADARSPVELDQTKVGRLSRMDALQGQAMSNAVAARRRQTLQRIDAALARIEDDEFGYCLICGDDIAVRRLELDPTIPTCQSCSKS